jgi:hypothetical protein
MKRIILLILSALMGVFSLCSDQIAYQIEKKILEQDKIMELINLKSDKNRRKMMLTNILNRDFKFQFGDIKVNYLRSIKRAREEKIIFENTKRFFENRNKNYIKPKQKLNLAPISISKELKNKIIKKFINSHEKLYISLEEAVNHELLECKSILYFQKKCEDLSNKKIILSNKILKQKNFKSFKIFPEINQEIIKFLEYSSVVFLKDLAEIHIEEQKINKINSKFRLIRQLSLIGSMSFNLLSLILILLFFRIYYIGSKELIDNRS